MAARRATVLFAHGSRDPLWSRPIEAVAQRMRSRDAAAQVRCAYLELTTPDLPTVVAELVAALEQPWDLVLSDYSMPGFNGVRALELVRGFIGSSRM